MGIWLYTGLPGAGKTLCVVKEVIENILKPDAQGQLPPVYADIEGLDYDRLGINRLVPEEETNREKAIKHCQRWYECPEGSYIIIDECQRVFPVRNSAAAVPRYVSEFETHRHHGFNIILITQGPNLIDKHIRTLVERHVHLKRTFGLERSLRVEWPQCEETPQSSFAIKRGVTGGFKFPKKYFGVYQSATIHNQQRRVPWGLLASALFWLLLMIGGFAWYLQTLYAKYESPPTDTIEKAPEVALKRQETNIPLQCMVKLTGVIGSELLFTDIATGREFQLPSYVLIDRNSGRDFLHNIRTGRKYLICT